MILVRAVVCTLLITRPSFSKDEVTSVGPSSYSLDAEPIRSNLFHLYLMTRMFGTSGRRLLLISFLQYVQELDLDPF